MWEGEGRVRRRGEGEKKRGKKVNLLQVEHNRIFVVWDRF